MNINIEEVKIEIYTPEEYIEKLRDSLTKIGACKLANYDHVVSFHESKGYWRPLEGSNPFSGEAGTINFGNEVKMEIRCSIELVKQALLVIKKIHPYETPLINVIPLLNASFEI